MERNTQVIAMHRRYLKGNQALCCLLLLCFLLLSCGLGVAEVPPDIAKFMEGFEVKRKKRKQELKKLAEAPLTAKQQKAVSHLLDQDGSLDAVLSSELYLAYLKEQTGKEYGDFPTYVAAMPTPKRKSTTLFVLKDILSPKTTIQEMNLCLDFYFKLRKLFTDEPDIMSNDMEKLTEFQLKHFNEPLMGHYSKEEILSNFGKIMQLSMVPVVMAGMESQVFHDAWRDRLEQHGSREGLLRCAIATPAEFALVCSFVKDTKALEKWILTPLKLPKTKKNPEKRRGDEAQ